MEKPDQNVRVQQKLQSRSASISFRSMTGETMSPRILIESRIEPMIVAGSTDTFGGTTSTMGLPWRVTRIGSFVLETRSMTAVHFALNSETGISFMKAS